MFWTRPSKDDVKVLQRPCYPASPQHRSKPAGPALSVNVMMVVMFLMVVMFGADYGELKAMMDGNWEIPNC